MCTQVERGFECTNSKCNFAHSHNELRATDPFYKIGLCKFYSRGNCETGKNCRHAHGTAELRAPVNDAVPVIASTMAQQRTRSGSEDSINNSVLQSKSTKNGYDKQRRTSVRVADDAVVGRNSTHAQVQPHQLLRPPLSVTTESREVNMQRHRNGHVSGNHNYSSSVMSGKTVAAAGRRRSDAANDFITSAALRPLEEHLQLSCQGDNGSAAADCDRCWLRRSTHPNNFIDPLQRRRASTLSVHTADLAKSSTEPYYSPPASEWDTTAPTFGCAFDCTNPLCINSCSQTTELNNINNIFTQKSIIGAPESVVTNSESTAGNETTCNTPRSVAASDLSSHLRRSVCNSSGNCVGGSSTSYPSPECIEPSPSTLWAAIDPHSVNGCNILQPVVESFRPSSTYIAPTEQFELKPTNCAATAEWRWLKCGGGGRSVGSLSTVSAQTNLTSSSSSSYSKAEYHPSPDDLIAKNAGFLEGGGVLGHNLRFDNAVMDQVSSLFDNCGGNMSSNLSSGDDSVQSLLGTARSTDSSVNSKGSASSVAATTTQCLRNCGSGGVAARFADGFSCTSDLECNLSNSISHPCYDQQQQQFSETAFVLPPVDGATPQVDDCQQQFMRGGEHPEVELYVCDLLRGALNVGDDESPLFGSNDQQLSSLADSMVTGNEYSEITDALVTLLLSALKVNTVAQPNLPEVVEDPSFL
eukprot:Lankesteria_metandrocarpae@DN5004_c0_g1_i1.p1